ncbi:MAG: lytic transglycosylase domain-containing protein [Patescibacteria group bacterium]
MSLTKESFKEIFRRVEKTGIGKKSVVLFGFAIIVLASTPSMIHADMEQTAGRNLSLMTHSPLVVGFEQMRPEIIPGESQIEKEKRLVAEARAEAQAKALALEKTRETISREKRVYSDPSDFNAIYEAAGAAFGLDPKLLKAIHIVETGASGSTSRSNPSGATGPMQFLPSTFRAYGVDGNGDGIKDITNVSDAIFSAAKYLKACGYPNVKKALWGYNPSNSYYTKVMKVVKGL